MLYDGGTGPTRTDDDVGTRLRARLSQGGLELPVLPEAATQVMNETAKPDWSAALVVDHLKRDPAMTAHLLRLCNSVAFRGASPMVSLQQAVTRLGASQLRQLAILIACETRVFRVVGYEPVVRRVFRHSVTTALLAREIARVRRAPMEDAFLVGLLHDVGWPLLMQLAVELECGGDQAAVFSVCRAEHAALARTLALQWRLPERTADALAAHHDSKWSGPAAQLAATVAFADALARYAEDREAMHRELVKAHPAIAELNLYPDAVDALLLSAPSLFEEAA